MDLLPAIDLKDGKCVRLQRGDMSLSTVYNDSPANQAADFARQGAEWIHVVDLDGAFAGTSVNAAAVDAIVKSANVKVELGGGVRSVEAVEKWLERGIERVILGTVALRDPELVKTACRLFPNRVAVGIDAKDGFVAVEGWAETSRVTAVELAKRFESAGVCAIIHTDIARDGVLRGPNLNASADLTRAVTTPVIVSGGVSSLDDIKACKAFENANIAGVVAGRAIYEKRFTVAQAVAVLKGK